MVVSLSGFTCIFLVEQFLQELTVFAALPEWGSRTFQFPLLVFNVIIITHSKRIQLEMKDKFNHTLNKERIQDFS